jgi:uncharacterized protein (DUF302 family)
MQPGYGVVTKASPRSVADTVTRLQDVVRGKGLTLFAVIEHDAEATKAGLTMQPAKLLIFGSPKSGTPVMVASPLAALDLPLKALVWQDHDGRVWVSYNSTAYLAERHAIPADLAKNLAGIDGVVGAAVGG